MRRMIGIFGIGLMVFAFVVLTIFIVAPAAIGSLDDAPLLKNIMQSLMCRSDEVLTAKYSTYSTPTSTTRSTDLKCVDREQNARDVSQQLIGIGAIGYLVPFLVGLFKFSLGRGGNRTQFTARFTVPGINFADRQADSMEQLLDASEKVRSRAGSSNPAGGFHPTLQDHPEHLQVAQRLRELKDAYSAGLLTESEYEAQRQKLVDES